MLVVRGKAGKYLRSLSSAGKRGDLCCATCRRGRFIDESEKQLGHGDQHESGKSKEHKGNAKAKGVRHVPNERRADKHSHNAIGSDE